MIQPFHFAKNIGKEFSSFYKKVIDCNGVVCFDFEDSINAADSDQRSFLKNQHRKLIISQLIKLSPRINLSKIGFRINGSDTTFYQHDLSKIGKLITKGGTLNCLFIPKVEGLLQLDKICKDIPSNVMEIIPIIETKMGFKNIEEILSAKDSRFFRIAFGHCDFNLSNRHFPFFHQDSKMYWNWIERLVYFTKKAGKQFINSPVLNLEDGEFFSRVMMNNKSIGNISGQITLCLKQTLLCATPEVSLQKSPIMNSETKPDKYIQASRLIEKFENHQVADRFFAVDDKRMLISPQEYQSAKFVLKEITA